MLKSLTITGLVFALTAAMACTSAATATHSYTAELSGPTAAKVKAKYKESTTDQGTLVQRLKIHVKRALPLQSLEVAINGQIVGMITTNPAGNGKLTLRSPNDSVPAVASGDVITVGPYIGVFLSKHGKYRVSGDFTGAGTLAGRVKYTERLKHGERDRKFQVNIEGAAPGETFDIYINDLLVGTLTADEQGEGSFKLRSAAFVHGDGFAPMLNDFPVLQAGDVVTVGPVSTAVG